MTCISHFMVTKHHLCSFLQNYYIKNTWINKDIFNNRELAFMLLIIKFRGIKVLWDDSRLLLKFLIISIYQEVTKIRNYPKIREIIFLSSFLFNFC